VAIIIFTRTLESADVYEIVEPGGMKPSEPAFEIELNLAKFDYTSDVIKLLIGNYKTGYFKHIKIVIKSEIGQREIKDFASKYARYLYQIISPNYEACRELLHISSKDYLTIDRYLTKIKGRERRIWEAKLEIAKRAYKISSGLLKNLISYRIPPL